MTSPHHADAVAWVARAPYVATSWFRRHSRLHGAGHTRRVHVHAQRLLEQLRWERRRRTARPARRALARHRRESDGVEPEHGRRSAERADELGLTASSPPPTPPSCASPSCGTRCRTAAPRRGGGAGRERGRGAPPGGSERALRVLWLLKDADALDRIRLGFGERADPRQLRHRRPFELIPFASALYAVLI